MTDAIPLVAVVGPTASGKSDLGVRLARRLDGHILNADALQLYRGMDIGTAKLSRTERAGIPHHLLDVLDVTEEASVADYQRRVRRILDDPAGGTPRALLVGGSGLYLRAVLDGLEIPPTDPRVRARWEAELDRQGAPALHARLREIDPEAAAAILPGNGRRVVRALEVNELTGGPFRARMPTGQYCRPAVQIGLSVPRDELDVRIARRVDRMWAAGFVEEVQSLERGGLRRGRTASRALGYAQVLRALAGEISEQQAREDTVRATRRFARRQESWFRRDPRVIWLPHDAPDLTDRALAAVDAAMA
jgi:tRNA dimethylallyltransferase